MAAHNHLNKELSSGDSTSFLIAEPVVSFYLALYQFWLYQKLPEEKLVVLGGGEVGSIIPCVCSHTRKPHGWIFYISLSQTPSISSISSEGREDLQVNRLETQIWIKPDAQKTDVDFSKILNAIQESKLLLGCEIN